jgi:class 3 adenylate cyclase
MDATTPLPTGTVTFLFTDIEGSTQLWEQHPEAMRLGLARHDGLLRIAIESHGGCVFKTVGDRFCAAFATVPEAILAALARPAGAPRVRSRERRRRSANS